MYTEGKMTMKPIISRFFRYISIDTQGDDQASCCPSNENQRLLADLLCEELKEFGVTDVRVDENSFLYAKISSNLDTPVPSVAFLAHLDTNPWVIGEHIHPRIVREYDGGDIILNQRKNLVLSPSRYPELLSHVGEDLIVTDGTTLLGADGKAGITEIMEAVRYVTEHPELKHGDLYIVFTPDEELGYSTDYINLKEIPADFGFTVEGGGLGEISIENFNAATATVTIHGHGIHPGVARNTMKNAVLLAHKFISCFPESEMPENTDSYEGYYHVSDIRGDVSQCIMTYHIRDFSAARYEERKKLLAKTASYLNLHYGAGTFEVQIDDYYLNMKRKIDDHPEILETAKRAVTMAGITPKLVPVRGGTDGAVISFDGFPCPNIFSGEQNGFSVFEYISAQTMEKAVEVIINIIRLCKDL